MKRAENDKIISLILAYRNGDEEAFEELFNSYSAMIEGAIRYRGLDVDEYFSEVCIGFLSAVDEYNVNDEAVTFGLFAKICIERRIIDILRKRGNDSNIRIDRDVDVDDIAVSGGIQSMLEHREQSAYFMKVAKDELSDFEYRVFHYWMLGYKTADIAGILDSNAKSVDNAKTRMMAKLKRRLTPD